MKFIFLYQWCGSCMYSDGAEIQCLYSS